MKRAILLMLVAKMCWLMVSAKTITCATCSQGDFEHAYYVDSQPGDTIVLPAGSATWGNASRGNNGVIYIITNVTVVGQGDSTVITLDDSGKTYSEGVIALWGAATFKHFKIVGSNVNPVTAFNISPYNNPATGINFTDGFRISDITYVGGTSGAYFAFINSGVNSGLIDNCRITGNSQQAELIFARGPANAWQISNTLGAAGNIFIEDCTYNTCGYVCDANANAHFVVRFCTINGVNKVDGHGVASNSPARSVRNMEVYHNNWTMTSAGNWQDIEIRGGTSMIFDNTSVVGWALLTEYAYNAAPNPWPNFGSYGPSLTAGNPTTIATSSPHGYSTGWPVWVQAPLGVVYGFYNITVTSPTTFTIPVSTSTNETADFCTTYKTPYDYPIKDQVGNGRDGAAREPSYLIHNTQGAAAWPRSTWNVAAGAIAFYRAQTGNGAATFTEKDIIQSNRDFFADAGFDTNTGVGRGTKAAMNAFTPSVAGYGWWVTDEGSWNTKLPPNTSGQLYTWNGSAWVLKYTPYVYPHPLQGAAIVPPTNAIISIEVF